MSSNRDFEEPESDGEAPEERRDIENVVAPTSKPPAKRRTKTGCLTCRKRRIKCGEERPTCKNCLKSKRECAGYVQPLVYRQHNHGTSPPSHDPNIQPPFSEHPEFHYNQYPTSDINARSFPYEHNQLTQLTSAPPVSPFSHQGFVYPSNPEYANAFSHSFHPYTPLHPSIAPQADLHRRHSLQVQPGYGGYYVADDIRHRALERTNSWANPGYQPYPSTSPTQTMVNGEFPIARNMQHDPHVQLNAAVVSNPGLYDNAALHGEQARRYSVHGFIQPAAFVPPVSTLANPNVDATSEDELDDLDTLPDHESEEEDKSTPPTQDAAEDLSAMLHRNQRHFVTSQEYLSSQHQISKHLRHRPRLTMSSPLRDERNERVFCHFVEITSKCMSIFERQPLGVLGRPLGTLWGFKMPTSALSHPALAHAILALGALHVAKLQQTSEDSALKHFTYSLRKLGKLLSSPSKRHEVQTLAAVLILGFYEVIAADHSRWNLHLAGAKKLLMEHNYASTTTLVRKMRRQARAVSRLTTSFSFVNRNSAQPGGLPESLVDDIDWDINTDLLHSMTGLEIDYENQKQPGFEEATTDRDMSEKEVSDYKSLMDLHWWYCKQDLFQSMVSGDPLLMPYEQWKYCPPRGQIGKSDIPYATFDHLVLVMARLTNFGGRDRSRKQRAVAVHGGYWKPSTESLPHNNLSSTSSEPGTATYPASTQASKSTEPETHHGNTSKQRPSPAPSANESRPRSGRPTAHAPSYMGGPPMYGMMPPPSAPVKMPASFHEMDAALRGERTTETQDQSPTMLDLEEATAKALAEHAAIGRALDVFTASLGPDFDPVPMSSYTPTSTLFGPALHYKSPEIACIWAHYHVARILIHRLHPHMPPAAMVAAGICAKQTHEHAQTIGKICAGLYSSHTNRPGTPLDPFYAGALMESTFPLLFAGVQYQDMSQRGWIITKLQDIARMTGWQTSASIAAACEIAWQKMGEAGRGPPYSRTLDPNNKDERVNGQERRLNISTFNRHTSSSDATSESEPRFMSHDRSLIGEHGSSRVHWALGLLSVEEDIRKLKVDSP